jgi:hypothetical protein
MGTGLKESLLAGLRNRDLVGLSFETFLESTRHFGFVFDDQNSHHGASPLFSVPPVLFAALSIPDRLLTLEFRILSGVLQILSQAVAAITTMVSAGPAESSPTLEVFR